MITKKLLTAFAFAFVLLFSGCAEDDFVEVDGVCPLVISTIPTSEAVGVPLNQVITATFNEVMKASTITEDSFLVSANGVQIAGTVSYTGSTATFLPDSALLPNTTYTGTITTLASDPRGNFLQENYVWTFTTLSTFTVAVSSNPTTAGNITGGGTFLEGTSVNLVATPVNPLEYVFDNWTEGGVIVPGATANYTFVLAGDRNLVANFVPTKFTIDLFVAPLPEAGTVTGTVGGVAIVSGQEYNYGTIVNLTATKKVNYSFVNWTNKTTGAVVSIIPNFAYTVIGKTELVANFKKDQYQINLSVAPLLTGTATGNIGIVPIISGQLYDSGSNVTVLADPADGYVFENWTENGLEVSRAMSYSFDLTKTTNLVANFILEPIAQFSLILEVSPLNSGFTSGNIGGIALIDGELYDSGSVVALTALENPGYTFVNWTNKLTGMEVSINPNFDYILIGNTTLVANFELNTVVVPSGTCPNPIVDLGMAKNFAILAESAITTTGVTSVTGDMGISPLAAASIEGFGLILDSSGTYSTSSLVTGRVYAADYTAPTPSNLTTTVDNMHTAFTTANGLAPDTTEYLAGNLNNVTLTAGVYKYSTDLLLFNTITLDGGGVDCAAFVFQIAGDLIVANNVKIILTGGAKADNIFWVTAGAGAVLGTDVDFSGNILAKELISLEQRTTVDGRLLAQTAVTLIGNTVVKPSN